MHRKIVIHPSFALIVLYFMLTQQLYIYALLIISLLIHELGHLLAAYTLRVPLRKLVLTAFGGQLTFMPMNNKQQLIIALGGPIFTIVLLVYAMYFDYTSLEKLQLILLFVNFLPIWPLDGGKVIYFSLQIIFNNSNLYGWFMTWSLIFSSVLLVSAVIFSLPIFICFIIVVIVFETIKQFRFRKYIQALQKVY